MKWSNCKKWSAVWHSLAIVLVAGLTACSSEDSLGELCFVGDSLVAGWDVGEAFPAWTVRNDGVSGARLEELSTWNLPYQDKTVVMLIGTNNLGVEFINSMTRPQFITGFIERYEATIQEWAPRRVFVISLLPRNMASDDKNINVYIKELNEALREMAVRLGNAAFVDVHDEFLYKGGLNPSYSLDGLHLNDLGYNILNVKLAKEL